MSEANQEQLPVEERARMVGWQPGGQKSAEDFLQRREEHMGAMRADNGKLEQKVDHLNKSLDAMISHQEKRDRKQFEAGYNRAITEQRAKMDAAAEEGDTEAYFKAKTEAETLEAQKSAGLKDEKNFTIAERSSEGEENASANPLTAAIQDHAKKRPEIFATEEQRTAWVDELKFHATMQDSPEAAFEAADRAIVARFSLSRAIPGGDSGERGRGGASVAGFDDLPAADKEVFFRFQKKFGDTYTKDKFLAEYNS